MISIEKYRSEDFDALSVMIGRLQEYERVLMPDHLKPAAVVADAYAKDLVETACGERGEILIARDDDRVVGCVAGYLREDDDPCLHEDVRIYGQVGDLYVEEPWRMRGIGRLLLTAIEEQLRIRGGSSVRATAKALNVAAVGCLSDFGYGPMKIVLRKPL
jgi:ribosomal protein S18 acetylase RimI-like enzyme